MVVDATLPKRYACCLYKVAKAAGVCEEVYQDIAWLHQLFPQAPSLYKLLQSPIYNSLEKIEPLRCFFIQHLQPQTFRFIKFVYAKKRQAYLPAMCEVFLAYYKQQQHVQVAYLTTVARLPPNLLATMERYVKQLTDAVQVEIVQHLDANLLGGYMLQVDQRRIDASLRGKLRRLENHWLTNRGP